MCQAYGLPWLVARKGQTAADLVPVGRVQRGAGGSGRRGLSHGGKCDRGAGTRVPGRSPAACPVQTSPAPEIACAPRGTAPTLKGLSHRRFSAKLLISPPADQGRGHSGEPLQGQSREFCSWAPGAHEAGPGLQRAQGGQGCAVRRASRERRARLNRTANLEDSEVPPGLCVSPAGSRAPWEETAEPGARRARPSRSRAANCWPAGSDSPRDQRTHANQRKRVHQGSTRTQLCRGELGPRACLPHPVSEYECVCVRVRVHTRAHAEGCGRAAG